MADLQVSLVLRAVDRASAALNRIKNGFKGLTAAGSEAQRSFKLAANVRQAAVAVQGFARVARRAVAAPVNAFESFEAKMLRVKGLSKATDQDFARLTAKAIELGGAVGEFSAEQVAGGMIEFAIAGTEVDDVMAALRPTLDLSTAAGVSLARSVDVVTSTLGQFGLEADQTQKVADILSATFTGSKTTLDTVAETFKFVAPLAKEAGLEIEQVAKLTGTLGQSGIDASLAGTALKGFLFGITGPTPKARRALDFLNVSFRETKDGVTKLKDPIQIMKELGGALDKLPKPDKIPALKAIFDKRSATGIAALIASVKTDKFAKFAGEVDNAEGSLTKLTDTIRESSINQTEQMTSAMDNLGIEVGSNMSPILNRLKALVRDMAIGITQWAKEHPALTKAIAVGTIAVAGITTVLGGALIALSTVIAGVAALKIGLALGLIPSLGGVIIAFKGAAIAALASVPTFAAAAVSAGGMAIAVGTVLVPVLAVTVALASLANLIFVVNENWDDLKASFEGSGFFKNLLDKLPGGRFDQIDDAQQRAIAFDRVQQARQQRIDAGVAVTAEQEEKFRRLRRENVADLETLGIAPIARSDRNARLVVDVRGRDGASAEVVESEAGGGIDLDVASGGTALGD